MSARAATLVPPGGKLDLSAHPTDAWGGHKTKEDAQESLAASIAELAKLQYRLYATGRYSLLVILQGMDASGKDSLIQHVMSGLNPQGVEVTSFKAPSAEELDHDFLWRYHQRVPRQGRIGIFNRSHYEDVLITRVHPAFVVASRLPGIQEEKDLSEGFWDERLKEIKHFERLLTQNGTIVRKFFLHLSKDEQRDRFLERLEEPDKHWKFAPADIAERQYWDDYQRAYTKAIAATSTEHSPWHVIPADKKWAARAIVADVLVKTLEDLDLAPPKATAEAKAEFAAARKTLED